jgi:hypothetical protein
MLDGRRPDNQRIWYPIETFFVFQITKFRKKHCWCSRSSGVLQEAVTIKVGKQWGFQQQDSSKKQYLGSEKWNWDKQWLRVQDSQKIELGFAFFF